MTATEFTPAQPPDLIPRASPWRRIFTLPNVLTFLFLAVAAPFVYAHPLWRDEAQAFLLARDSHTPWELVWNMRYEGHPPLWHFILWLLTRITVVPEVMQWLHLAMAAASVYIFTRFSPLPWPIKILFPFGYFTLFEYNILARNYQLLLLLTLILCALWQHRRFSFLTTGILLGLLSMTHLLGVILAGAMAAMLLVDALCTRFGRAAIKKNWLGFILGLLIFAGLTALALKCMIPAPDGEYAKNEWTTHWDHPLAQKTFSALWNVYVPIPTISPHFWDQNFITDDDPAFRYKWGLLLAAATIVLLMNSWRAVLFFILSAGGAFIFFYAKLQWATAIRHQGVAIIALIAAFWIAWVSFPSLQAKKSKLKMGWRWIAGSALFTLLAVQTFAAARTLYLCTQYEFSPSKRVAALIQKNLQPGDILVSGNQAITSSVAAYLPDQKFYFPNGDRWGTFTLWDKWLWKEASDAAILKFARAKNSRVIIVRCFKQNQLNGANTLANFPDGGVEGLERFSVQLYDPHPK